MPELALNYIKIQNDPQAWLDHLQRQAEAENQMPEDQRTMLIMDLARALTTKKDDAAHDH